MNSKLAGEGDDDAVKKALSFSPINIAFEPKVVQHVTRE